MNGNNKVKFIIAVLPNIKHKTLKYERTVLLNLHRICPTMFDQSASLTHNLLAAL